MKYNVKTPQDCSEREINAFIQLVLEGGQVVSRGLKNRILNARLLAFCYIKNELVGISSIKQPSFRYKTRTFKNALVEMEAFKHDYELGYTVTKADFGGNGISFKLNSKLLSNIDSGVYATTANPIMIHLLEKLKFRKLGNPFKGKINKENLYIYSYRVEVES